MVTLNNANMIIVKKDSVYSIDRLLRKTWMHQGEAQMRMDKRRMPLRRTRMRMDVRQMPFEGARGSVCEKTALLGCV